MFKKKYKQKLFLLKIKSNKKNKLLNAAKLFDTFSLSLYIIFLIFYMLYIFILVSLYINKDLNYFKLSFNRNDFYL